MNEIIRPNFACEKVYICNFLFEICLICQFWEFKDSLAIEDPKIFQKTFLIFLYTIIEAKRTNFGIFVCEETFICNFLVRNRSYMSILIIWRLLFYHRRPQNIWPNRFAHSIVKLMKLYGKILVFVNFDHLNALNLPLNGSKFP